MSVAVGTTGGPYDVRHWIATGTPIVTYGGVATISVRSSTATCSALNAYYAAHRRAEGEGERERQRQRELGEAVRAARDRARELLCSFLDERQRADYERHAWFEVVGSHGGRYRIGRGHVSNVSWLDEDGEVGAELCAHPNRHLPGWQLALPDEDVAVGQLLHLQTDEPGWLATANADEFTAAFRRHRDALNARP